MPFTASLGISQINAEWDTPHYVFTGGTSTYDHYLVFGTTTGRMNITGYAEINSGDTLTATLSNIVSTSKQDVTIKKNDQTILTIKDAYKTTNTDYNFSATGAKNLGLQISDNYEIHYVDTTRTTPSADLDPDFLSGITIKWENSPVVKTVLNTANAGKLILPTSLVGSFTIEHIVPFATAIQEYPFLDLRSSTTAVTVNSNNIKASVNIYQTGGKIEGNREKIKVTQIFKCFGAL